MWKSFKCRNGTGESGYMGFAQIYANIISFLLEEPGHERKDYYQLVENNREIFTTLYSTLRENIMVQLASDLAAVCFKRNEFQEIADRIKLVEPRELLNLLNLIETHSTRLHYAPRPFYRSNIFCLTSLLQMKDNMHVACMFCGWRSPYQCYDDSVCFASISESVPDGPETTTRTHSISVADIGGSPFSNDLMPESQKVCREPLIENGKYLHHEHCPIVWLYGDKNAVWNYKDATFIVRGVSKFHHMMQFLTVYPRPREDASWLCLINRMSSCYVPGASEHTLKSLFRIIAHERLKMVVEMFNAGRTSKCTGTNGLDVHYSPLSHLTSHTGPPLYHYREPMHVNQYVSEVVNLADDPVEFENQRGVQLGEMMPHRNLPFGGSHTLLTPAREETVTTRANEIKPYTTAHRPFNKTFELRGKLTAEAVFGAFTDHTVKDIDYYRLLFLHGFMARPLGVQRRPLTVDSMNTVDGMNSHICLYCAVMFPNELIYYKNAMEYYTPVQAERVIKYAIAGANEKHMHRYVYGRSLPPISKFQATFPGDLRTEALPQKVKSNERQRKALVWLSASMDALHRDDCLFRLKKRSFVTNKCCVCFTEKTEEDEHVPMTCGHEFCVSCYNEISITDCCMCKRGYRTRPMNVSESVLLGYIESKVAMCL